MNKRKALKTVAVILLLCALVFVAYEIFTVRNIKVSGCETKSADDVVALAGIKTGEFVLDIDTNKSMESLAQDPYIKPVSVKIEYPNCVNITIAERKETAYIQQGNIGLIIDNDCWLLKIASGTDIPYTAVNGISLSDYKIGEKLDASDDYQLDVLSDILKVKDSTGTGVKSIDLSIAADVVIELDNGFKAELGDDTNLEYKFKLINSSIEKLLSMGKTGGTVDVASGTNAYYREK